MLLSLADAVHLRVVHRAREAANASDLPHMWVSTSDLLHCSLPLWKYQDRSISRVAPLIWAVRQAGRCEAEQCSTMDHELDPTNVHKGIRAARNVL